MAEVRTTSSTGGEKGMKDERHSLIPTEALAAVARHYGIGARKYADHNWRRGYEWSKSYDALQRHAQAFWGGEDIDEETGSPHMAAVASMPSPSSSSCRSSGTSTTATARRRWHDP